MAQYERSRYDPTSTLADDPTLWTNYSYANEQQEDFVTDTAYSLPLASPAGPYDASEYDLQGLPAPMRRTSFEVSSGSYYPVSGTSEGLGFDSYLDPPTELTATLLHPPVAAAANFLAPPSPGFSPLSSSANSTASSSSALLTPYGPFDATPSSAAMLLPAAPLSENDSDSCFAKLQESYLYDQHRADEPNIAADPSSSYTPSFSTSAPVTPRRNGPSATQLWRSPSSSSVCSSPTKSPYAHRAKPYDRPADFPTPSRNLDSPSRVFARRNSTLSDGVDLSPTKPGRRQRAQLSIDVPSKQALRSRLPVIAASPQVPSSDGRFDGPETSMLGRLESHVDLSEATLEQVEHLLQEFGPLAPSGSFEGGTSSTAGSLALSRSPSVTTSDDTRYCISGVSLSREEIAQLDDPALTAAFDTATRQAYPNSAPPYQTTFDLPDRTSSHYVPVQQTYQTQHAPSPSYVFDSATAGQPLFERWSPSTSSASQDAVFSAHGRSISAPRSAYPPSANDFAAFPSYGSPTSQALAHTYSTHSLPSSSSPPSQATPRRRSSFAARPSPSSWAHPPPRPMQVPHSYSYGPPAISAPSFLPSQSSSYHNVPLPLRPMPAPGAPVDPSPPPSPTKQSVATSTSTPTPKSKLPPAPAAASPSRAPTAPVSPKKKRGGAKARNPAAMFVNFSAADAKKLLSGVAPSGSSKKKREEEEAAAAAAAAEAAGSASTSALPTPA
ncbi:uncharacterized protein JCM15063_000958 [Sporobolomyces koalae]|uniref:uncharacterized protein n=1 Tax=Sporobolomyces koalae TaxID=500713 RepID=UPI003178EAA4